MVAFGILESSFYDVAFHYLKAKYYCGLSAASSRPWWAYIKTGTRPEMDGVPVKSFMLIHSYWNIHDVAEVLLNASTARTSIDPVPLVGAVPVGPCICMVDDVPLKGMP